MSRYASIVPRRPWSTDEDAIALALRREGKSDDTIGRELHRTPSAVAQRLCRLRDEIGPCHERRQRASGVTVAHPAAIDAFLRKPL
jgi:hypothetical protein